MFAVIETGGKQYKVQNDDVIYIEKLAAEENSSVDFKVVALDGDDGLKVGAPYVEGATVTGTVLKNGKGKKITVFTYKAKKARSVKWVTDSPIPKYRLPQLTHNCHDLCRIFHPA
jgi:large subunit ribosomal protein L21